MKNETPLKEELTTAMHSEFSVDDETDVFHRCITIWCLLGTTLEDDVASVCKSYGVTVDQALEHYDACMELKRDDD